MITFYTPNDVIKWNHPQPVVKARLQSKLHGSIPIPFTDSHVGPVPQDVRDGVYRLLVDTECGCFSADARVYLCHPPQFTPEHTHTHPDADQLKPECC